MFNIEAKVLSYDCDMKNKTKISAIMRYLQEIAGEHLAYLGAPAEVLKEEDMVFLLSKMCIKVHRMPTLHEKIIIGTSPTMVKGVRWIREFVIESEEGERLISAISFWPLIQVSTRKVLRPTEFKHELKPHPSIIDGEISDIPFPKIKGEGEDKYIEHIKYSDLDVNKHVNNTVYGDFISDALPYELMCEADMDTVVIGFQNEAVIDDVISISRHEISDKEFYVTGSHSRAECFKGLVTLK